MMDWQVPTLVDVLAARRNIAPYLRPTPLALPSSIACASRASQFPSGEFGDPTKLQPQPGSQLHASRYVPAIRQVLT